MRPWQYLSTLTVDHDPANPGISAIGIAQKRELAPREELPLLRHVAGVIDPDNGRRQAMVITRVAIDQSLESLYPIALHDLSTFDSHLT